MRKTRKLYSAQAEGLRDPGCDHMLEDCPSTCWHSLTPPLLPVRYTQGLRLWVFAPALSPLIDSLMYSHSTIGVVRYYVYHLVLGFRIVANLGTVGCTQKVYMYVSSLLFWCYMLLSDGILVLFDARSMLFDVLFGVV